jgi:hypothetical protein
MYGWDKCNYKRSMEYIGADKDKREKIQASSLAKECYSMKLDLLTNATVVEDAIRFVSDRSKDKQKSPSNNSNDKESNEPDYDEDQDKLEQKQEEERTGETSNKNKNNNNNTKS